MTQLSGVEVSGATIAAVRAALSDPRGLAVQADPSILAKATTQGISTTTGLVGINLEAPAKNLFPVLSPIRNWMARRPSARGATAVQWRAITGINTANVKIGVAERSRNSVVTTKEADFTQSYKPFGLDDFVTYDAQDAAVDFMDVRAEGAANLLAAVMVGEEKVIVGGNVQAIGKPGTITFTDVGTGGSLSTGTAYDYAVSALTSFGYPDGATGHGTVDAPDETDGRTGSHTTAGSGAGSTATTLTWAAVRGAVAYNVYIGTSGGTKYYSQTVTVPKALVTAVVGSGNVPNSADQTADSLSWDGLIPQIEARFDVSKNKATFLAEQETNLLVAKFREERFKETVGDEYTWMTSHDSRVRHDHKVLDGQRFFFSTPPITNRVTGARNNPGEDFRCRCVARPVLKPRA